MNSFDIDEYQKYKNKRPEIKKYKNESLVGLMFIIIGFIGIALNATFWKEQASVFLFCFLLFWIGFITMAIGLTMIKLRCKAEKDKEEFCNKVFGNENKRTNE